MWCCIVPEVEPGLKPGSRHREVLERFGVEGWRRPLGKGLATRKSRDSCRSLSQRCGTGSTHPRTVRARQSRRRLSAHAHAQRALDALLNARSTPTEIARAREVAQQYRWAAAAIAPEVYGSKIQITRAHRVGGRRLQRQLEESSAVQAEATPA